MLSGTTLRACTQASALAARAGAIASTRRAISSADGFMIPPCVLAKVSWLSILAPRSSNLQRTGSRTSGATNSTIGCCSTTPGPARHAESGFRQAYRPSCDLYVMRQAGMCGQAPIDHDCRSCDKRCFVGGQETYGVVDLLGLAHPADGILTKLALESLDVVAAQHLRHAGIDGAGTDAVYANSVLGVFQCGSSHEVDDAGFGRVVCGHPVVAGRARDRGSVDDRSAALFAHDRHTILDAQERA